MTQVSNGNQAAVTAILTSFNDSMQEQQPDIGFGYDGERPPGGEHDNYLIQMDLNTSTFNGPDGTKIPSVRIKFKYKLVSDVTRSNPLEWFGESFNIPQGGAKSLPAGDMKAPADTPAYKQGLAKFFAERDERRLRGHIETILGRTATNVVSDLAAVGSMISNPAAAYAFVVYCEYTPNKKKPGQFFFAEYVRRAINPTPAAPVTA